MQTDPAIQRGQQVVVRLSVAAAMLKADADRALLLDRLRLVRCPSRSLLPSSPSPDILIADRLDETTRTEPASPKPSFLGAGHPKCHVCVLTRPSAMNLVPRLPARRAPLDRTAIDEHRAGSESLLGSEQGTKYGRFPSVHDSNASHRAATLAARNPLLLGFLVRLHADGVALGKNRAALYEQVVRLVHASKVVGRETESDLGEAVANRVLDILGWLATRNPVLPQSEAVREIGRHLERELGIPRLRASQEAERALRHWEDRRLIERLMAGSHEAFVFLHPSLGEFSRPLRRRSTDSELGIWLKEVRAEPRWRQPLLLAAGLGQVARIIPRLIAMDRPDEPTSTESVLAAAALTESEADDPELSAAVVERLSARLTSPLPVVAVEAAAALRPMAAYASRAIGPIAAKLVDLHPPLPRLAATALSIAAGARVHYRRSGAVVFGKLEPTCVLFPENRLIARNDGGSGGPRARCHQRRIGPVVSGIAACGGGPRCGAGGHL